MKKFVSSVLMAVMIFSATATTASAQTGFFLGSNSYSYNNNKYCKCTLSKPGKKDATVKVTLTSTGPMSIKMTDNNGRHLWSEDYSIRPNSWNSGSRTYKLGKNNSVYRLYFKSTNGKGSGFCSVTNPKNCTIA